MKQEETLEEAAEKYALDKKFTTSRFIGFIDGGKW
jgi:hypothetical protein